MPAYNAEKYIERTIQSLLDQTYDKWELIVVDDASDDTTPELILKFSEHDSRIRLIRLEKNYGGPAGPRNIGVKCAKFNLIAFLDSDDLWHPQKLEKQLELLESFDAFFLCTSMIDFKDETDINILHIDSINCFEVSYLSQSVRAKIPASSVMVLKNLIMDFPFNEKIEYKAVEDFDCWLRLLKSGIRCLKIREPLLFYRKSDGQISGSKFLMMKKVFMVHRNLTDRNIFSSFFFTISHVMGGFYSRFLKKGM